MRLLGKYRRFAASLMLIVFAYFFSGSTLFVHTHFYGSQQITHSHPYLPGSSQHSHSASCAAAIDFLNQALQLMKPEAEAKVPAPRRSTVTDEATCNPLECCGVLSMSFLRAPPAAA